MNTTLTHLCPIIAFHHSLSIYYSMITSKISLGNVTQNKSSVRQSGHSEENILLSSHKIDRPISKYIKKNALKKIANKTPIRKHQPCENKTEINMQSPSISCLYADHLYKKGHNNFVESIAVEKYRKKYQEQKLSKENFEYENGKMKEQIRKINQDLCSMKFAYRTLTIESKQLREQLKEKELISVENRAKSTNRNLNQRSHRRNETPKKIHFKNEEQKLQIPFASIKENMEQIVDISTEIKEKTHNEQSQTIRSLKSHSSRKKIMKRINTIEMKLQQASSIKSIKDQIFHSETLKLKLIQIIEDGMPVIREDPSLKEQILHMLNGDDMEKIFILNAKIATMELNFGDKCKIMHDQAQTLSKTIALRQREIIELQQRQAGLIQCIQLKEQQIFTQKERVSLCQQHLQTRSKEIAELKASIKRIESQNIMYLRKEEERKAQALALKKFWQGLKINNQKINLFMQEQFNDMAGKCEGNFQEKISYLAHLYRKKQLVYDEYVSNNTKMMKQNEVMIDSLERKLYDNEKLHQKLADLVRKGEESKAIATLVGYCQINKVNNP